MATTLLAPAAALAPLHAAPQGKDNLLTWQIEVSSCREVQGRTGVYQVGGHYVLCDMSTEGGGWTLVASGRRPIHPRGGDWYGGLTHLQPRPGSDYVWWHPALSPRRSDVRISCAVNKCAASNNCSFDVDMVFYDTLWYWNLAHMTDHGKGQQQQRQRCYRKPHPGQVPERCDLLSGRCLEGQRSVKTGDLIELDDCEHPDAPVLDMRMNLRDGLGEASLPKCCDPEEMEEVAWRTEWGEVDGAWRCGVHECARNAEHSELSVACSWFVWVRGPQHSYAPIIEALFDSSSITFAGEVLFFVTGAILAAILPVSAYFCASFLFAAAAWPTALPRDRPSKGGGSRRRARANGDGEEGEAGGRLELT